jgi:hypothetical protein
MNPEQRGGAVAGVFLSCHRDDIDTVRSVALALEKACYAVWWDRHLISRIGTM